MSNTTPVTDIPKKQKAWLVVRRGKPRDAVVFNEEVDVSSKLEPGEVLVKVQAAAFNPVGYKIMGLAPNFLIKRPHVAENDFTGIIVDANGTDLHIGQEVYGFIPVAESLKTRQGALSQYLRCTTDVLVIRPSFLKPTEAAGLGIVGTTAYHALFNIAKLEPGQHIFINGGSTGVGIAAIQIAKSIGCTVTASGSSKREELFKSLGVDTSDHSGCHMSQRILADPANVFFSIYGDFGELSAPSKWAPIAAMVGLVQYTKGPLYKQLESNAPSPKFHAILEAVGVTDVRLYTHSNNYLGPGGLLVSVGPWPHGWKGVGELLHLTWEMVRPTFLGGVPRKFVLIRDLPMENLKKYGKLVDEGKAKPIVDSVYSFQDVHQAYDRVLSSRAAGKVVVKVDPDVE